jgi:hypothetical protein
MMEEKSIVHNKKEVCKISGSVINTKKDNYAILIDCSGEEIKAIGFYKGEILRALIKGDLEDVKKELLSKHMRQAKTLMNSFMGGISKA